MLNKVILMGRLTADPELRQTQSGIAWCSFMIAVNRQYKSNNGENQADFIKIQAWRQTAEFISKYFSKSKMIIVEGELQNNNYESNGVKHYSYVVKADNVSFGESKSASNETATDNGGNVQQSVQASPQSSPTPQAQPVEDTVQLGDLDGFEEILSDGKVPF